MGARLRTRKVTGRDASLPALLLSAFVMLVGRGTVGALPQTPQGTLSLDPSARLSWSRFHAPSACSFLLLRLSPCLLPQDSVKNQKKTGQASLCRPARLIPIIVITRPARIPPLLRPQCGRRPRSPPQRCRPDGSHHARRRSLRPPRTDPQSPCRRP